MAAKKTSRNKTENVIIGQSGAFVRYFEVKAIEAFKFGEMNGRDETVLSGDPCVYLSHVSEHSDRNRQAQSFDAVLPKVARELGEALIRAAKTAEALSMKYRKELKKRK